MKKIFLCSLFSILCIGAADAYQLVSTKELGRGDALNQNVIVRCTTPDGKVSNQSCSLRRYVRCRVGADKKSVCGGWQQWKDLRNPGNGYSDWRGAASACCRAKGLR
ncbi:MAG: hypothetical protein LBR41_01340 [Rickettsiales bacterium]|nr:hypothetical protein [Rickettsiales bacterium]